jgi:hypothetical protein
VLLCSAYVAACTYPCHAIDGRHCGPRLCLPLVGRHHACATAASEECAANSIHTRVGGRCCLRVRHTVVSWLCHLCFSPTTEVYHPCRGPHTLLAFSSTWSSLHPRPAPPKFLGVLTPHHSSSKHFSGVAPEPRVTIIGLDPTRFASPQTCPQSSVLHFYLPASLLSICTMVYVKFSYSNQ